MNILSRTLLIAIIAISFSCSTKQYVLKQVREISEKPERIFVVQREVSDFLPVGVYPKYKMVDNAVLTQEPSFGDVTMAICENLDEKGIRCIEQRMDSRVEEDEYYITYRDYWAWDFKIYMHVLKINLYYSGKLVKSVVSQGNTAGMHDYPMPKDQVPLLLDLLLNDIGVNVKN